MENVRHEPILEQRVLQFIQQNRLIPSPQKVVVAVSGGPDSVCLLHTLYHLQQELKIDLHVAHLNHQLRGDESDADAEYVAGLAGDMKLPATIEKRDVAGYRAQHHLSLEEAAREVRYGFLAEVTRRVGAEIVAVGHTLNDQVETILLHIIRGTGTRGLRGLQPCNVMQFQGLGLTVIRPLLCVKREETEQCCSQLNLKPCQDISNLSHSLLRNRVRRELLPLLQSYNSGIFDSLLRIGRIAQDDLVLLEAESLRHWSEIVRKEENTLIFDKKRFRGIAPALQRHLMRMGIDDLLGTLKDIESRHIEEIMDALVKPPGRRVTLPEGLIFYIDYDRYLLGFSQVELIPFPELEGEFDILIPGKTQLPGWTIEASVLPGEKMFEVSAREDADKFAACFDKTKVGAKIKVRARQSGDWFQPLGMSQTKKVGQFMLDSRIPQTWRSRIPIACTPQQIIWIAGYRIDERVKVTQDTSEVLCLKMWRRGDEQSGESRNDR